MTLGKSPSPPPVVVTTVDWGVDPYWRYRAFWERSCEILGELNAPPGSTTRVYWEESCEYFKRKMDEAEGLTP